MENPTVPHQFHLNPFAAAGTLLLAGVAQLATWFVGLFGVITPQEFRDWASVIGGVLSAAAAGIFFAYVKWDQYQKAQKKLLNEERLAAAETERNALRDRVEDLEKRLDAVLRIVPSDRDATS